MKTHRSPSTQAGRAGHRDFTWSVHSVVLRDDPGHDEQAALDGSDSGNAGCAVTPLPARQPAPRRAPRGR
jgi:hypothetical protein